MLRLRHTAHLNALPYHTFHQQPLTHKERDRYPTHQTHRCRCATAPIGYKTVGVGAKACNAPCWQADCSVSAVLVVVCAMCHSRRYALAEAQARHLSIAIVLTHHDCHPQAGTKKKHSRDSLWRVSQRFVLQFGVFYLSEGSEKKGVALAVAAAI